MAKSLSREIWVVGAKRTAFGTFGGALKDLTATDLAVEASKAALAQSGVAAEDVDHVIFGNVQQTSADAIYHARHVGLRAGIPVAVPALTVRGPVRRRANSSPIFTCPSRLCRCVLSETGCVTRQAGRAWK